MENLILAGGAVVALIVIWRYATRKVKGGGQRRRGGVVVVPAPSDAAGHAQGTQRVTFGTIVMVNIISAMGSAIYIYVYGSGSTDGWWLFGALIGLFGFPIIAMKVLEAIDPGERFSLMGSLAALCILAWLLAAPWFVFEIVADIRGR